MKSILFSGHTDPGKRRKENQDTYTCKSLWSADKALMAVVDGVGGYAGGDHAARIARESIEQYMQIPRGDTLTMLREAVTFANNRIVEERKADTRFSEMCCVLTAAVADVTTGTLCFVHVGDTRLYRYRNGQLQKLTKDHSFVGIKEDAGEISELEAMNHPHRNQILREVGSAMHRLDDEDFMDHGVEQFQPGDILLLCSDGLTDMITSQQISTLLSTGQSLNTKVSNLVALANEMGGYDNITVVLLQNNLLVQPAETPVAPVEAPAAEQHKGIPAPPPPKTYTRPAVRPGKRLMLWAVLLVLLVAAAGWYFSPAEDRLMPLPAHATSGRVKDTAAADSVRDIAIRALRPAAPRPLPEAMTDTLRLTTTKNYEEVLHYADSVKKTVLLMPAKNSNKRFAAIEITRRSASPGDTLIIRNLRFCNFETAIKLTVPVVLKPENIWFDNVKTPVTYTGKPDSTHRPVLFMNVLKQ